MKKFIKFLGSKIKSFLNKVKKLLGFKNEEVVEEVETEEEEVAEETQVEEDVLIDKEVIIKEVMEKTGWSREKTEAAFREIEEEMSAGFTNTMAKRAFYKRQERKCA